VEGRHPTDLFLNVVCVRRTAALSLKQARQTKFEFANKKEKTQSEVWQISINDILQEHFQSKKSNI
jgi:hypothetical protein